MSNFSKYYSYPAKIYRAFVMCLLSKRKHDLLSNIIYLHVFSIFYGKIQHFGDDLSASRNRQLNIVWLLTLSRHNADLYNQLNIYDL